MNHSKPDKVDAAMKQRILALISLWLVVLLPIACASPAVQGTPVSTVTEATQINISTTASPPPTAIPAAEISQQAQPTLPATGAPSSPAVMIPLQDALGSLQPQDVFQNFYEITQVPRQSGHMEQIRGSWSILARNSAWRPLLTMPVTSLYANRLRLALKTARR